MKHTRFFKILTDFLILCLLFCSCYPSDHPDSVDVTSVNTDAGSAIDGNTDSVLSVLSAFSDEIEDDDLLLLSHSYTFQALSKPEDGWEYQTDKVEFHDGMLCIHMRQDSEQQQPPQNCVAYLDTNGNIVKTVPYSVPIIKHSERDDILEVSRSRKMIDENTFLYSSYTIIMHNTPGVANEVDSGYLVLCDAAGNIVKETLIPGYGTNSSMKQLNDGRIAVIGGESVCIFDSELNLIGQIESGAKYNLQTTPLGELIAEGQFEGNYYRLDLENYASSAEIRYQHPKNVTGIPLMYFSVIESAYEVYYSNDTGFWGYNVGDADAELLCSWQNSGQVYSNLTILGVLDADRILISFHDPFSDTETIGWLYRDPNAAVQKKIPIRVGIVEEPINIGLTYLTDILRTAANRFNAHNSQYFIEIVQYGTRSDKHGDIPDVFTEAMLAGEAADIIVTSKYIRDAMRMYSDKKAFVDLHDALGDIVLPCVNSAYTDRYGALYSIPMQMTLSMLVCSEDYVSADENLTLDRMYTLAEEVENSGTRLFWGGDLTLSELPGAIRAAALPSFADEETGDCYYDSEEFGEFLLFLENLMMQISKEQQQYYDTYGYHVYEPDPAAIRDTLQTGETVFLNYPFQSMADFAYLKLYWGDTDFVMHGYPTRNEELVRFDSSLDFHLNAASNVKLGAAQFLAYLLSDEVQLYSADTSLPVTVSAIEKLLEYEAYIFESTSLYRLDDVYDEDIISEIYRDAIRVTYDEDDIAILRRLFYETGTSSDMDETMNAILEEELSAYRLGIRSLEETQKILQSRLWIYVNE